MWEELFEDQVEYEADRERREWEKVEEAEAKVDELYTKQRCV